MAADPVLFENLLSEVSARLVASPPDRANVDGVLDLVRTALHADHCAFLKIEDETHAFVVYGSCGTGDTNLAEAFPWTCARLAAGAPVVVHRMSDLPPEAAIDREGWERDVPARSALLVPIGPPTAVGYAAVVHWVREECQIPDSYLRLLRVVGEMVLGAHQRTQADAESAESERRVREHETRVLAAAAAAGLGFTEWTTTERPYMDDRACDLLGISAEEMPSARTMWLARLHPDDRPAVEEVSRQLVAGGLDRVTKEYRYRHPQRGETWLRHSACRVPLERSDTSG